MYPTTSDALGDQFRSTRCCGGCVPEPAKVAVAGEPGALVTNEAVAVALPLDCGVKVMVNVALWPVAIVMGRLGPVSLNSELLTDADETVTLAPLAVKVAVMFLLAPTITLPKLKLVGVRPNWPTAVPLPDKVIGVRVFDAVETTAMLPLALPALWGEKVMPKVKLSPASRSRGKLSPVTPKPVPLVFTCEMVTVDPPVLLNEPDRVLVSPT